MNLLDKFLEVGGTADGISPALSFVGKALGETEQLTIPLDYMVDIERYLKQNHFPTFNGFIIGDAYCFDVLKPHYQTVLALLSFEFALEIEDCCVKS